MTVEQVDAQFKLVEQIHNLRAEVERLRSIAFGAEEYARTVRKATIEECARVASQWCNDENVPGWSLIVRIRALKEKPQC